MASTIKLKSGTGSAVPSALSQGEVAINVDNGLWYYGSGSVNTVKQLRNFTSITASSGISSSGKINSLEYEFGAGVPALKRSSNNAFLVYDSNIESLTIGRGTDLVTTHNGPFKSVGAITGSNISASGAIITQHITASSITSSGTVHGTIITADRYFFHNDLVRLQEDSAGDNLNILGGGLKVGGNITSSQNISSSGTIIAATSSVANNLTVLGDIITSGSIFLLPNTSEIKAKRNLTIEFEDEVDCSSKSFISLSAFSEFSIFCDSLSLTI